VIDTPAALAVLTARVRGAPWVALDTEFHQEGHYAPRLMLLQLQLPEGEPALVDGRAGLDLGPLGEALSRTDLLLHGAAGDLRILAAEAGLRPGRVFDTQVAAALVGEGWPRRLQDLVEAHLGVRMAKTETVSDWSRRPLSDAQRDYAEDDVRVLPGLANALRARLAERGRTALDEAVQAERVLAALTPTPPEETWRTLPGAASADAPTRAALAALAAWRDEEARARDVPRHQIVHDGLMLEIARRRPATLDALRGNRRVPGALLKRDGASLLAVLERAGSRDAPAPLRPWPRPWADTLRAAASALEATTGIAADLLVDDVVLGALAQGAPLPGWREAFAGDTLRAVADGHLAVRADGRLVRGGGVAEGGPPSAP
jgi:ribonuclease D